MSYFVVKKSGNQNKSIELKTSKPPKPYMAVKRSGTVGYLPLTTETSGAGIKIKKNNKNYKVVESYTTSIDSSSTYNSYYNTTSTSYYTQTTGTNYVPCDSFSIYIRSRYNTANRYKTISLYLSITSKSILQIYSAGITDNCTSIYTYGTNGYSTKTGLINIVDTVNNLSLVNHLKKVRENISFYTNSNFYRYTVDVITKTISNNTYRSHSSNYYGWVETASFLTKQYTRPSAQYQTYSKATSYYTVSTTSQ